jgi:peptidoglycan/LPS O-acetylase OafA/YrhL
VARAVISNVQILRFVAAGSVLLTHSASLLVPPSSPFFRVPWVAGVDLFFVISGFIMAWLTWGRFGEDGVPGRFLLRRAIRIVPPYWFFTTLMVAAALFVADHVKHTRLGWIQIVTSYGFVPWPRPSDGLINPLLSQGWTLNYEAFFYVAFALALTRRHGLRWLSIAFLGLAAVHWMVPRNLFILKFYTDPIILEFLAGIAIARLYLGGVRLPVWGSLLCAALAVAVFLAGASLPHFEAQRFVRFGVSAALLSASLILARESSGGGRVKRFLTAGGDASYTLYLSHTFTVNAVAVAWRRAGVGAPWLGVALAVALSLAAALLLYRFAERPATQALNRRFGLSRSDEAQRVAP